jgi:Putative Ig domain
MQTFRVVAAFAAFLVACGSGSGSDGGTGGVTPPSGLTYSTNPALYSVGVTITPNSPSTSGGAVVGYAVSPALPAGLTLDAATGIISGKPTAAAAQANYKVTAANAGGSTTDDVTITVQQGYTIGGFFSTVPGVNSGLVLATPGEPNLLNPPQPFTFANPVPTGTAYNVTIETQSSGGTCTVLDGGVGVVGTSNVSNVEIGCAIELP